MKTVLISIITNVDQAKDFLTELHKNGESFHPEDDATELIGNPFTLAEGLQLNNLMGNIYDLDGNEDCQNMIFDPCEYLIALDNK